MTLYCQMVCDCGYKSKPLDIPEGEFSSICPSCGLPGIRMAICAFRQHLALIPHWEAIYKKAVSNGYPFVSMLALHQTQKVHVIIGKHTKNQKPLTACGQFLTEDVFAFVPPTDPLLADYKICPTCYKRIMPHSVAPDETP